MLAAVAREHAKGRRLFIATTNLDAGALTTWDLGEIASSGHPGALQRYRDVILASASFPLLFPPVYIPLDMDGNSHSQMHVDGSIRSNVFAASFMLDLDNALRRSRLSAEDVREELWVIHNGQAPSLRNDPVDPQAMTIAEASINNLLEVMSRSSVSELYTLAMVHGFAFSYASIPQSFQLGPSPLEFDQEEMQQLFELGYEGARSGNIWQRQQAPAEPFELLQVLDPELLRIASGHYPHIPHRPPRWINASEPLVEPTRLTLCSGGRYGNYYRVAQKIREQLAPMNLQVVVLTTEGSMDNLERFVRGRCDAAIAQHDAYFLHLYSDDRGLGISDQQRPKYLFDDYVHVVCNAKAGVERLEQLAEDPEKHRMLIGSRRSGSAATWEVLKRVDQRYQAVPTEPIGGDAALAMVAANDRPACMLFVASLQTPLIRQANEEGTDLNLVSVEPDAGYYVEIAGERIYRIDHFEPGTYENLQDRLARTDVPTVSVGVSLIVSTTWAREHPAANRLLSSAVVQARQYLLESIERN